jgi:outer membrane receptor protein involved in Fe transport
MKFFASNLALLFALAPLLPGTAAAQSTGDASRVLEEVIVTASKREVALQDLAMSVGVLTGDQLQDIGAIGLEDYWRMIPSLNVRDGPFGGNSVIIRGLSDSDSFNSTESLSAFYVDDTAMTYVTSLFATPASVAMVDVQRVEVLRGPQGSLVGANAMGGAIRIVTNEPDPTAAAYRTELNVSNTAHGGWNYGGQAILNRPTGENSALRLAAFYQYDDGFIDDIGLERKDINDRERAGARLSWLWNVSDRFEVLARVYGEHIDSGGYDYTDPLGKVELGLLTEGDYQAALLSPEFRDEKLGIASLRLRWTFDWGEIYSATNWYEKELEQAYDWSKELYFDFFGIWNPAPFGGRTRQEDLSQELRIRSDGDGALNWLAGLYYLDQEYVSEAFGTTPGLLEVCPPCGFLVPPDEVVLNTTDRQTREDLALFGEITWRFADRWEATLGGRWYRIDRTLDSVGYFGPFPLDDSVGGESDDFVPKASLSWDLDEQTMVYGLVSRGFRPGQFNNAPSREICGARAIIDSDDLTNYEAGVKSRFAGGRVSINATVFHIDWDDIQTNLFKPECGFVYLENAGKATSDGVEFDFSWLVSDRFTLQGGFGYNEAELAEDLPDPDVDAPAGTRIPNVPRWTANIAGTWNFNWSEQAPGYLRVDAQYVGSRTTLFDQSPDYLTLSELDSYTLVNLRLGGDTGSWRTELFANNLFDEVADLFCCRYDIDTAIARPRTVGVRAIWIYD